MSIGTVVINNLNLMQGAFPAVERYLLFVGVGTQDVGNGSGLRAGGCRRSEDSA